MENQLAKPSKYPRTSESFTPACAALKSHPFEGLMGHAVELKSVPAKEGCNLPVAPHMFFTWLPGRECGLSKVGWGWDVLKRHKFSRYSTTSHNTSNINE